MAAVLQLQAAAQCALCLQKPLHCRGFGGGSAERRQRGGEGFGQARPRGEKPKKPCQKQPFFHKNTGDSQKGPAWQELLEALPLGVDCGNLLASVVKARGLKWMVSGSPRGLELSGCGICEWLQGLDLRVQAIYVSVARCVLRSPMAAQCPANYCGFHAALKPKQSLPEALISISPITRHREACSL